MYPRLSHAARFAGPTFVAVLTAGLVRELALAALLRNEADALSMGEALGWNLGEWAVIAAALGAAVFLVRLGDARTRPPTWRFAWVLAAWVAGATGLVATALEHGRATLAAVVTFVATTVWLLIHRRIPGWPGADLDTVAGETAGAGADRDLRGLP